VEYRCRGDGGSILWLAVAVAGGWADRHSHLAEFGQQHDAAGGRKAQGLSAVSKQQFERHERCRFAPAELAGRDSDNDAEVAGSALAVVNQTVRVDIAGQPAVVS
jgi:hypothetical protein